MKERPPYIETALQEFWKFYPPQYKNSFKIGSRMIREQNKYVAHGNKKKDQLILHPSLKRQMIEVVSKPQFRFFARVGIVLCLKEKEKGREEAKMLNIEETEGKDLGLPSIWIQNPNQLAMEEEKTE